jgi:hypothetical protein
MKILVLIGVLLVVLWFVRNVQEGATGKRDNFLQTEIDKLNDFKGELYTGINSDTTKLKDLRLNKQHCKDRDRISTKYKTGGPNVDGKDGKFDENATVGEARKKLQFRIDNNKSGTSDK